MNRKPYGIFSPDRETVAPRRGIWYTVRMIRLIVTDLDGTLLHTDKSLPEGFGAFAEAWTARGGLFVAASGRQYANVYATLAPHSDNFYILGDNGTVVGKGKEILRTRTMTKTQLFAILDCLPGDARPLICAPTCGWYADETPDFVRELKRYYICSANVGKRGMSPLAALRAEADVRAEIGEAACKVAVYCHGRAEEIDARLPNIGGVKHVVSGADWVDIAPEGINKGVALAALLDELRIGRDECLAFGDQNNDREMLELCGQAFVTSEASADMRARFPVVGSHEDDAVLRKMRELL